MIGVDIVDLRDPLLRKRSEKEMRFISHPEDISSAGILAGIPSATVFWMFWAAKEAVFKTHRLQKTFAPKEIGIVFNSVRNNLWEFEGVWQQRTSGRILVQDKQVFALATMGNMEYARYSKYGLRSASPSSEIRRLLTDELSGRYVLTSDSNNLPLLTNNAVQLPVSFSHHHHSGAVAWLELADGV